MTPTTLMAQARRMLFDETVPYKWPTAELVDYYNFSLDEISRDTDYFIDSYTPAVEHITLVAGTSDYAYDSRILQITGAKVSGSASFLTQISKAAQDLESPTWRYKLIITGTDISFVDGGASADSIVSTTTDFLEEGIIDDDYIRVDGATETANSGIFLLDTAAANLLTMTTAATLTTEAAGDQVVIKVINVGTPSRFITDYRDGYITLYPAPDEAGVLTIDAVRSQLTALTSGTISSATIPIRTEYHLQIIDGILSRAFLKSGPSTYNVQKAGFHKAEFAILKDRIKKDRIKLKSSGKTSSPHAGCM